MAEPSIIFSASDVVRILSGSQTQTRRLLKLPVNIRGSLVCPWGKPGELLWVREPYRLCQEADDIHARYTHEAFRVWYEANAPHQPGAGRLRQAGGMPRWASRLTLRLTGVRSEMLKDLSEADAIAEGAAGGLGSIPGRPSYCAAPIEHARSLWEEGNGPGTWDENPWVWVLRFEVVPAASLQHVGMEWSAMSPEQLLGRAAKTPRPDRGRP